MTGKGRMSYPDGDFYLGEWKNGLANGGGAYDQTARGGGRYEDYWLNDKRHGYGEEKCPDGSWFRGEYGSRIRRTAWGSSKTQAADSTRDSSNKTFCTAR